MVGVPNRYIESLEERDGAFHRLLEGEDDLGMIIRAHIYIEHELKEFIQAAAPEPGELKFSGYDYAQTLKLALVLGLDPRLKAGLTSLGTLRNKFAHRLGMQLTSQEARQIYSTLSPAQKTDARQAYASTILKHPNTGRPKDMLRTTPKDLIAICLLMLRGGVMIQHVNLRYVAAVEQKAAKE